LRAHENPEIARTSTFEYEDSAFEGIEAAIHYAIEGNEAEIKWLGSLRRGLGAQLLEKAIEQERSRGPRVCG